MAKSKKTVSKRQDVAPADYAKFVTELKKKIRSAQFKAALAVNRELIRLYWDIGKEIIERKEKDGWGSGAIDRIARDIQNEFPGIEGFSRTNMGRMRAFYLAYSIYPQAVGKLEELPVFNIPWGHNIAIFEGVKSLGLETCMTLGMLNQGQAESLKESGLDYYNHNIDIITVTIITVCLLSIVNNIYNSSTTQIQRLERIEMFSKIQRTTSTFLFVFMLIFTKNIDSAT
jgi:hypothetical protein